MAAAVGITIYSASKSVTVQAENFGDRPTSSFKRTPTPAPDTDHLRGNFAIGGYNVSVDWPASALEPTIITTS